MLQALLNEDVRNVKNSIVQLIGILGKHEFINNTWPEVLQFIHTLCSSNNPVDMEVKWLIIFIVTQAVWF